MSAWANTIRERASTILRGSSRSLAPARLRTSLRDTKSNQRTAASDVLPARGGTLKGFCKPGPTVWSRIFVEDGELYADLGQATVIELPAEETERRRQSVTSQWPIMHVLLHGITRDQFVTRHHANPH